ncbi:MAG: hypothetical protein FWC75_07565 [Oscillospiraceae bacterium]|nr:hypothetical protein [Oscillospiraceae bacterium]
MRKIIIILLLITISVATMGCAAILEDERVTENPHVFTSVARPPDEQIEVSNFEELRSAILDLIKAHETEGRFVSFAYDTDDVQEELDRAIHEILTYHPLGVYAVHTLVGQVTKIVVFFEINISIEYVRTREQLESIVDVSTFADFNAQLLEIMSAFKDEAVFRTILPITVDELFDKIIDVYYRNPRKFFMRPVVAVEVFPEIGADRIFSISFDFGRPPGLLGPLVESLSLVTQSSVEAAHGETDAQLMLSLARNLIAVANFDEATARTLAEHGIQNPAATAFGALINGSAIGEGFAMAFQALCDELGLRSQIILGSLDGRYHAWNLVHLGGYYYHIDVSMGDIYGIENTFFKTDLHMLERRYVWDLENTPRANGILTYDDVTEQDEYEDEYAYDIAEEVDEPSGEPSRRPPVRPPSPAPGGDTDTGASEPEIPEVPEAPDDESESDESDDPSDETDYIEGSEDEEESDEIIDPDDSETLEEPEETEE